MSPHTFDATITLSRGHLADSPLRDRPDDAARLVGAAVRWMSSAGYVDVEYVGELPASLDRRGPLDRLYSPGIAGEPRGMEWSNLRDRIEAVVQDVLRRGDTVPEVVAPVRPEPVATLPRWPWQRRR